MSKNPPLPPCFPPLRQYTADMVTNNSVFVVIMFHNNIEQQLDIIIKLCEWSTFLRQRQERVVPRWRNCSINFRSEGHWWKSPTTTLVTHTRNVYLLKPRFLLDLDILLVCNVFKQLRIGHKQKAISLFQKSKILKLPWPPKFAILLPLGWM